MMQGPIYFAANNYIYNNQKNYSMLPKGVHIEGTPVELEELLKTDKAASDFFESLSKSYKQGYCDWVGAAKQEETRKNRAAKALIMLQKGQKTLKT